MKRSSQATKSAENVSNGVVSPVTFDAMYNKASSAAKKVSDAVNTFPDKVQDAVEQGEQNAQELKTKAKQVLNGLIGPYIDEGRYSSEVLEGLRNKFVEECSSKGIGLSYAMDVFNEELRRITASTNTYKRENNLNTDVKQSLIDDIENNGVTENKIRMLAELGFTRDEVDLLVTPSGNGLTRQDKNFFESLVKAKAAKEAGQQRASELRAKGDYLEASRFMDPGSEYSGHIINNTTYDRNTGASVDMDAVDSEIARVNSVNDARSRALKHYTNNKRVWNKVIDLFRSGDIEYALKTISESTNKAVIDKTMRETAKPFTDAYDVSVTFYEDVKDEPDVIAEYKKLLETKGYFESV